MAFQTLSNPRCHGLFILLALSTALSAAPRLTLSQTTFTVSTAAGTNGATQTVNAINAGDGTLNLSASSSVTWLTPSVGASTSCSLKGACIPIQIALQTSSLAKGIYTGTVTISAPAAVDAPQFVTVTVQVGGDVPDKLEFYVAPGGSASSNFTTVSPAGTGVSASSPWLAIAVNGTGSFTFNVPYLVTVTAASGMAAQDYNGTVTVSGSSFAPDNKAVSVLMHVTTQPILQSSSQTLQFRIAQGANKQTVPIATTNAGQGTLTVSGVTAAATGGGTWLSAATITGGLSVTADPTGLQPNVYQGTVTVASNAANASVVIPVQLTVEASGAPVTFAGGVVNNGTFAGGESLAQGDIVALFGDQLSYADPQSASSLPLATTLANTKVLVNGVPAPVYYVAPGQIDFEVPIDAATGDGTVQVVRGNQSGNLAYVNIGSRASRFLLINGGPYVIMTTPAGALTGIPGAPAHAGDVVVIYVIGLGPTSPSVPSGTASPGPPNLAVISDLTQICFMNASPFQPPNCSSVAFVGLSPNFVGLYQINATIPSGLPSGPQPFYFTVGSSASDNEQIVVQ